jgi:hypothetical protein
LRCKGDVCSKRAYIVVAEIKKRSKSAKKLKSPIKVRILSITKHNVKYFCKRLIFIGIFQLTRQSANINVKCVGWWSCATS